MKYSVYEGFRMKLGSIGSLIVGIVFIVKSETNENFYLGIGLVILSVILYFGGRQLTKNYKDC